MFLNVPSNSGINLEIGSRPQNIFESCAGIFYPKAAGIKLKNYSKRILVYLENCSGFTQLILPPVVPFLISQPAQNMERLVEG